MTEQKRNRAKQARNPDWGLLPGIALQQILKCYFEHCYANGMRPRDAANVRLVCR